MSKLPMNRAFCALGSNIEPEKNLPAAVDALKQFGRIVSVSRVWESRPVDAPGQPDYLNAAVLMETQFSAAQLCRTAVPTIEEQLGRIRDPANKYAPRTIDIDIVLYNRDILQVDRRKIPDPDILQRLFLAVPLAELDSDYIHPESGTSLGVIAAKLDSSKLHLRQDVKLTGDQ